MTAKGRELNGGECPRPKQISKQEEALSWYDRDL